MSQATAGGSLPRSLGPYTLLEVLGRGGMGVVYRAEERATGAPAAVKTLELLEEGSLASLRREVQTLERLQYPGVVRILRSVLTDRVPWYAMELIEGVRFDALTASSSQAGEGASSEWLRALRVIQRLCETLSALHAEGVVHRDLKPANVIVRSHDEPVLVDFGLVGASSFAAGREALEAGGEVLGTFEYMAPEQALGQYVDARADLYSLGCMLYELVTGAPPFTGEAHEIMEQHIRAVPVAPSKRNANVPAALDSLILDLLVKEPRQRVGYASDVAARLSEITGEPLPDSESYDSHLYRPSFSGRSEQLAALSKHLGEALSGCSSLVLIRGESGVGKTRLAMELTREATARGVRVITGECLAAQGAGPGGSTSAPLHPLRPLLRAVADHCRASGVEATESILGGRGRVLGVYESSLLGIPGLEDQPEPPPLPADAARQRLLDDLLHVLRAFALDQPLLLVLDDLQWADELTLALLGSLDRADLDVGRVLAVGTLRSEEKGAAVEELFRADHVSLLQLDRIDPEMVDTIVSDMLAVDPAPPALVRFLAEQSEGNPFFVAEYLRTAVESGLLERTGVGRWEMSVHGPAEDAAYEELDLPGSLRDLLERRISGLTADAQACLETAAVLGREFGLDESARLCGQEPSRLLEAADELLHRQVVDDVDGQHFRFCHDKLREAAYLRIPAKRRRHLHRRAGEMIEESIERGGRLEEAYGLLAHHWSMAGVDEKALVYLGKAGEGALRTGAAREAQRFLVLALEIDQRKTADPSPLVRARWRRMLGEACAAIGDLDGSVVHCDRGVANLGRRVPQSAAGWLGVLVAEALEQLRHRTLGAPLEGDETGSMIRQETARASGIVATSCYFSQNMVKGVANSLRCINAAEIGRAPSVAALSYSQIGYVAGGLRLHRLARWYFKHAGRVGSDTQDPTSIAAGLYFQAMYETGLGHWPESERLAEESFERLRAIGNSKEAEVAATTLANTLYLQGRLEDAADCCDEIYRTAEVRGDSQRVGWALFLAGRSQLALGSREDALDLLERGYASLRRVPDVVSLVICEGLLAQARLDAGRRDEAIQVLGALHERHQAMGRRVAPLVQCVDGYRGQADVRYRLWQDSGGGPGPARDAARRAAADLAFFARLFPVAMPAGLRARARFEWGNGGQATASRLWARAVRSATALQMPFDEALAHADLARAAVTAAERDDHRKRAEALYAELGCVAEPGIATGLGGEME